MILQEEKIEAFHKGLTEIINECKEKNFREPNTTDFGLGWRKAEEYYEKERKELLFLIEEWIELRPDDEQGTTKDYNRWKPVDDKLQRILKNK